MNITEPNPTHALPPNLYRQALNLLHRALPLPLIGNPADTTERDAEAMEKVISLRPANAHEAALAVQFVASDALAMDIMQVMTDSPVDALKHWAASANMMRQSRGALASLQRTQAIRMKQERGTDAVARRFDALDANGRVEPARTNGATEDLPPMESVSDFGALSQLEGNETPVRRDGPVSAVAATRDRPAPAPFVPDPETISQMVANETLTRRLSSVSAPGRRHTTSPARFVPSHEMISRVPNYEASMRSTGSLSAATAAPDSPPLAATRVGP